MRVLVCGGRDYGEMPHACPMEQLTVYRARSSRERFLLRETLDHLLQERQISAVISGGAKGADRHANEWACGKGVTSIQFKADWQLGAKAGPLRNQRMIDEGKPDLVIAFPGGKGTADMVRRAKAAGITVKEIS